MCAKSYEYGNSNLTYHLLFTEFTQQTPSDRRKCLDGFLEEVLRKSAYDIPGITGKRIGTSPFPLPAPNPNRSRPGVPKPGG